MVPGMSAEAQVLVVGAGGLGCAILPLLAARGISMIVVDDDHVSLSNLQRQILFQTDDVGRPKVEAAASRLRALLPGARIEGIRERLTAATARQLVSRVALVLDGSDNLPTRFLMNDACVLEGRPLVHGGILRFSGQVLAIRPGETACYRCLFEDLPPAGSVPSCAEAGVLGALCGIVGSRMVEEASGLLGGAPGGDRLWTHDALAGRTRWVELERDRRCEVCGDAPTIRGLEESRYVEELAA